MTQLPQGGGREVKGLESRKGKVPGDRTEKGPGQGRMGGGRRTRSSAANYLCRIKHSALYTFSWYLTDQTVYSH
jgi:hypothetical protein